MNGAIKSLCMGLIAGGALAGVLNAMIKLDIVEVVMAVATGVVLCDTWHGADI